jgi:hypothetical protein
VAARLDDAVVVVGCLAGADGVRTAFVLDRTLAAGSWGDHVPRIGVLPGESERWFRVDTAWVQQFDTHVEPVLMGVTGAECDLLVLNGPDEIEAAAEAGFLTARCVLGLNVDGADLTHVARRFRASGWIVTTGHQDPGTWVNELAWRLAAEVALDLAVTEIDPTAILVVHRDLIRPDPWGALRHGSPGQGRVWFRPRDLPGFESAVAPGPGLVVAAAPPDTDPERFLQAQVTVAATGVPRRKAFRAGTAHQVTVFVAPGMANFLRAEQPFDETTAGFAPGAESVSLDVYLKVWLDDEASDPRRSRIHLPRTGPSTPAFFPVEVPDGTAEVRCEISLYAKQRMLQSVFLVGAVATADRAPADRGLRLIRTLHLAQADQPAASASLRLDSGTGEGLVVDRDGGRPIRIPHAATVLRQITGALRDALRTDDVDGGAPNSPQQVDLLRRLARRGHQLFAILREENADLGTNEHLQIVSDDADEVLPLEFTYDYGSPSDTATLCTRWQDVAPGRHCTCRPRGQPERSRRTICPVGFWGVRMVIERHLATRAGLGPDEVVITTRPATGRPRLAGVTTALLAASRNVDRVNPSERQDTDAAFAAWLGDGYHSVQNWTDWRKIVRGHSPALLVSLSHTESTDDDISLMIGARSKLRVDVVGPHHTCGPGTGNGPVVLLIGCSTAGSTVPWQSVAAAFRRARAPVVVGTLIETLGRQAAPMAREVVAYLSTADEDSTVGELLRAIRRTLLARGFTLAMALVAVGDADWVLPATRGE